MGPLHGIKIVEFAALGPAPMGTMLLADLGADVVCVMRKPSIQGRPAELLEQKANILNRNRHVVHLDLKKPEGVAAARRLIEKADVLIEGYRPGVMERLELGPDPCLTVNPRLVFARMTGWGQSGPLAHAAGHDINYVALSGALHAIGEKGRKPVVPLNLIADMGGGALFLVVGVLAALIEARSSGQGQVVDVAMTDGSASLMAMMYALKAMGQWTQERGSNLLDGGAHFYDTYRCADGKYLAIGPIEPQFYELFLAKTGLASDPEFAVQWERQRWSALKEKLSAILEQKTRDEWCALMEGTDACVAPVLDMDEAPQHPHNRDRGTFIQVEGVTQPAPAPRFSRTVPATPRAPSAGETAADALLQWGLSAEEVAHLSESGAL